MSAGRRADAMYLLGVALYWFGLYVYIPILSPDVLRTGGTLSLVGLVVAAYGLPQLLLRIPIGTWSDRIGRRRPFVLMGLLMVVLSGIGMAAIQRPQAFLLLRLLAGCGAAAWVVFAVAYAGRFAPERRAHAMGLLTFANTSGTLVASMVGGILAQDYGWRAPFVAGAVAALLGTALVAAVPERVERAPSSTGGFGAILRSPPLQLASLLGIAAQIVTFVTVFGYVPVLASHLGMDRADLGLLTVVSLLPTAVVQAFSGTLLRLWATPRVLLTVGFAALLLGSAGMTHVLADWQLVVLVALIGIGRGLTSPILMALAIVGMGSRQQGSAMAVYQAVYSIGMVGGPALAGWIAQAFGLPATFAMAAVAAFAALVLALWRGGLSLTGQSGIVGAGAPHSRGARLP